MIALHDEILSTIERRGLADGVPVDQLDTHIADVLGVPPDHYAAWQLVRGAIASYAAAHATSDDGSFATTPEITTVAGQLSRLWEQLGQVHQASVAGVPAERFVRELIGELFVLTDWLLATRDLDDLPSRERPARDLASEGASRG